MGKKKIKIKDTKLSKKMKSKDLLPEGEISSKDVKVRITTSIDLDVLEELKRQASKDGIKYQTLLNKYLRACVFKEVNETDLRILTIANS